MNNISPEKKFNLNSVVLKEEEDPSLSIKWRVNRGDKGELRGGLIRMVRSFAGDPSAGVLLRAWKDVTVVNTSRSTSRK